MDRASFLPIVAKAARKALMNFFFIFVLCPLFFVLRKGKPLPRIKDKERPGKCDRTRIS